MSAFSIGAAVESGFAVVRRNPGAICVWAMVYWALTLPPTLVGSALSLAAAEAMSDPQALIALLPFHVVGVVLSILTGALLTCAVYRVVLEPDRKLRWYLALGAQERWIALVGCAMLLVLLLVGAVVSLPVWLAAAVLHLREQPPAVAETLILVLLGGAALAAWAWVAVRLSLALPMSFERRAFCLKESWALTRRHAWRMFVAYWAAYTLLCFALFAVGIVLLIGGLLLSPLLGLGSLDALLASPAPAIAFFAFVALPLSVLNVASYAITLAPGASIYRQLSAPPATASGT